MGSSAAKLSAADGQGLWDKRQVASYLGVSLGTVNKWTSLEGGGPPFVKIGPLVRFVPADVLKFIAQCRKK